MFKACTYTELRNNLNFQAFAAPAVSRSYSLMSRVAPDKINNNGYYVVSFLHFPLTIILQFKFCECARWR